MEVSFYLKRPDAETTTAIFARICYAGYKLKFYTSEKINPKFWSKENQRARETAKYPGYPEFNARLKKITSDINNIFRRYVTDNNENIPSPETLKELLGKHFNKLPSAPKADNTFFGFFAEMIKHSENGTRLNPKTKQPLAPNTLKVYRTTLKHLKAFQETRMKPIDFDTIDLDFYSDYLEFLNSKHDLKTNAIGKYIQTIKTVLNEATEKGINKNFAYKSKRFMSMREGADSIYLNKKELIELEALDLAGNKRLEVVRDLFLIGCYTGLRYSDYSILNPQSIKEGFIEITQTKTGGRIVIPIHETINKLLVKYDFKLPNTISNQKTNKYLKEIAQLLPSLQTATFKTYTVKGKKVTKNLYKWEMISTHTGRRSFATNEYLAGTPSITIMAITGHKTEKDFLKYIKVTSDEHARLLKGLWQQREHLKAV